MNASSTMTGAYWGNGVALMLTIRQEGSPLIEIKGGSKMKAVTFTSNGEYLVGGGEGLGVWRVKDGKQIATMIAQETVKCLAVSKDGGWIAAGTDSGEVFVWDTNTFEQVFSHWEDTDDISGVDFSPNSESATRLLVSSFNRTATVWEITTRKRVLTLHHEGWVPVIAAKYSPQGDRIATATRKSVRVWDSNDGRSLVDIPVTVTPYYNTGFHWFNNHLFVVSGSTVKRLEASTLSTVSEWPVPDTNDFSCIALPKHGEFIAYSTNRTVTFWGTSTHSRVGQIQHTQDIRSLALSPDDRFLAIGAHGGKITIRSLSRITVSIIFPWIMANLISFLVPLVFLNRIQSHCLVYIPPSRYLTFKSTMLRSIRGSTLSSRTQRRY
jgi:WD40 repeat protein